MDRDSLSIVSKNKKLLKSLINLNYSLDTFINCNEKTIFCPFHYNVDTPSAQVYKDLDGIYRIYCFSENRQYTSYDYIKLILGRDPITYLYNLDIDESIIEEELALNTKRDTEEINFIQSKFNLDICTFFNEIYAKK